MIVAVLFGLAIITIHNNYERNAASNKALKKSGGYF
jgi:hypothetical protein